MNLPKSKILSGIDHILGRISKVLDDTKKLTLDQFIQSDSLLCDIGFSLAQIGETMEQLESQLKAKYWNLPWAKANDMKNLASDDKGNNAEKIYAMIQEDLPSLQTAFLAIKNDLITKTIETKRLTLRKIKPDDAEPMFRNWASDPEVTKYLKWYHHEDVSITKTLIQAWIKEEDDPKTIRYFITEKGLDEPIGSIDVVGYVDGAPEIGYCLSRTRWGKGYMTEACKAFVKYLLDIGFDKILIKAHVENLASNRVIEKCGFVFTQREDMEHCSPLKPEPVTVNVYEIHKGGH